MKTKFQSLKTTKLDTFDLTLVRDVVSSMRSLRSLSLTRSTYFLQQENETSEVKAALSYATLGHFILLICMDSHNLLHGFHDFFCTRQYLKPNISSLNYCKHKLCTSPAQPYTLCQNFIQLKKFQVCFYSLPRDV